jgi:hypothetical protein
MTIPKTIMQTFKDEESLNDDMRSAMSLWKRKNPDWKYEIFYDDDCKKFIKKHFNSDVLKAFDIINPGAGKADLFRYCYLYVKGGVYADVDTKCIKSLNSILDLDQEFISVLHSRHYGKYHSIYQAFIACKPGYAGLNTAIMLATYNIINKSYLTNTSDSLPKLAPLLKVTGTKLLADAINITEGKALNSPLENDKMFPFKMRQVTLNSKRRLAIIDNDDKPVIQCKYDGYDPGTYWTREKLYS